jgi:hypothetical protein
MSHRQNTESTVGKPSKIACAYDFNDDGPLLGEPRINLKQDVSLPDLSEGKIRVGNHHVKNLPVKANHFLSNQSQPSMSMDVGRLNRLHAAKV